MKGHLFDEHARELAASAITDDIITGRGYRTIGRPTTANQDPRAELKRHGIPTWATSEDRYFPGLLIPVYRATGDRISVMWKPRIPVADRDGKLMKYASPKGRASLLDVHPANRDRIADPTVALWITEGIKKADSLTSRGLCTIALSGVYNWRSTMGSLGDWEDIPLRGRTVVICFDADTRTNPNVQRAMIRFGRWLKSKGVKTTHYLITPPTVGDTDVKGVDDYFAAGGTLDDLRTHTTTTPPVINNGDDTFTDSRLAETVADEVFDGGYCWAAGHGWLRWDGRRWTPCTDVTVGESIRQFALDKFAAAVTNTRTDTGGGGTAAIDGWRHMLGSSRQRAVTNLARGIVERNAAHFDRHPDLLNTPTGVVNLETGDTHPHDPDLLMIKMAGVGYRPDAHHPDWDQALQAMPDDVRDYMQIRLGQALTGHMPPDDVLIVMHGGGNNGKTTISETLARVFGDYFVLVSDRALMGNPGDHPTELMDFMGARYAVLEETPEARRLDPQRLKRTVGTPRITARHIRKDSVTFDATHSLFLSTNHRPVVDETDHGTWRRLQLVTFPYRYRKPWEALETPRDRRGDMGLRDRCKTNPDVWAAALAWLVEGAKKWYANDKVMPEPPASVQRDSRKWRAESDLVLAYLDARIVIDPDSHVLSAELLADLNQWLKSKGHNPWSDRTLSERFSGHDDLRTEKKKVRKKPGLSRPPMRDGNAWEYVPPAPITASTYVAWTGIRFAEDCDLEHRGIDENAVTSENANRVPDVPARSDCQLESPSGRLTNAAGTTGTREELTLSVPDVPASTPVQQTLPIEEEKPGGPPPPAVTVSNPCPDCRYPPTSYWHLKHCTKEHP